MGKRCLGACCTDIGLKVSPDELAASYNAWMTRPKMEMSAQKKEQTIWSEIWLLYPMLKFVKKNKTHPEFPLIKQKEDIYHYECKFFDKKKKVCSIYDIRPEMCRSYPNKDYCANPDCKWTEVCKTRPPEIKANIKKYKEKFLSVPE